MPKTVSLFFVMPRYEASFPRQRRGTSVSSSLSCRGLLCRCRGIGASFLAACRGTRASLFFPCRCRERGVLSSHRHALRCRASLLLCHAEERGVTVMPGTGILFSLSCRAFFVMPRHRGISSSLSCRVQASPLSSRCSVPHKISFRWIISSVATSPNISIQNSRPRLNVFIRSQASYLFSSLYFLLSCQ